MQAGPLVLTVTPNPSLDLLFEADRLVHDDANRLPDPRRRPGGQGINVARAVHRLGGRALAVALLGGRTGAEIEETLAGEGLPLRCVAAAGETRTFVAVRQRADGHSLLLNARGPARTAADERRLEDVALDALRQHRPRWFACCGSLPDGFSPDFYARLAGAARLRGARVVVDCDGAALAAAAPHCHLLVPNQHEAGRLTGARIGSAAAAFDAADRLRRLGPHMVAVTLGADGAVLVADGVRCHARAAPDTGGSAVGAGDVFLAALLVGLEAGGVDDVVRPGIARAALRTAVAAATAALRSAGVDILDPARIHGILRGTSLTG